MKYTKTLQLSLLLAIATLLTTGLAQAQDIWPQTALTHGFTGAEAVDSPELSHQDLSNGYLISQSYSRNDELNAYVESGYTYWDADLLAIYWGQSLEESKARIGRKLLWGEVDIAILEQYLLDARLESLAYVEELRYFSEIYTYEDAEILADFWGDPTPYDAKLRAERNIIWGNIGEVDIALALGAS